MESIAQIKKVLKHASWTALKDLYSNWEEYLRMSDMKLGIDGANAPQELIDYRVAYYLLLQNEVAKRLANSTKKRKGAR